MGKREDCGVFPCLGGVVVAFFQDGIRFLFKRGDAFLARGSYQGRGGCNRCGLAAGEFADNPVEAFEL